MTWLVAEPFLGLRSALGHPITAGITLAVCAVLAVSPLIIFTLARAGTITAAHGDELFRRYRSWLVLAPQMFVPVLLGGPWTIAAVTVLSLLSYREFARATGHFREKAISLLVVIGILAVTYAAADHWYRLFIALPPMFMATIAAFAVLADQPKGYIQRVALGILSFMLFGSCFGHISYFVNDADYRPILLMLLATVQMNDIFAYIVGRSLGRRKLMPGTSPNKTLGGALGALILTTPLVAILAHYVFSGTRLDRPIHLITLGVMVSLLGQFGDLVISSVKRDLGIKDMGVTFPGHGGLLDRFDSLILVAPGVFHYVNYFVGVGMPPGCEWYTWPHG